MIEKKRYIGWKVSWLRGGDSVFIAHLVSFIIAGTFIPYGFSCKKISTEADSVSGKPVREYTEILGRLSNSSITINYLFDQGTDFYCEYGTLPGSYPGKTEQYIADKDVPKEVTLKNLQPNTQYYYRTRFRQPGSVIEYNTGTEHSFHTQRPAGSTFTFAIEADPHLDVNSDTAAYAVSLKNILAGKPDFMLDLGDTFFP